jgi:hypothetical protein
MNWFEVIKENRLVTDTVTHTKVDEKKEPEKEDGRCKEKLRNIIFKAWDAWEETQAQNNEGAGIADYFDHPVNMIYTDMANVGVTVMVYGSKAKMQDMLDKKEDFLKEVPEETCCHILELMQRLDNQKVSDAPEGPHLHSTENNLLNTSTSNSRGPLELDGNFIGFVNTRVAKEFYDDGYDRMTMEDLDDFDQVNRELDTYSVSPRELVFACFKKFSIRVGWNKNNIKHRLSVNIYAGQIRRLEHWDCGECEEDRKRMMRDTDDKFSELIR